MDGRWSCTTARRTATFHELQTISGVAGGTFAAPDHEYPSRIELRLTATDSGGMARTASVMLDPQTVPLPSLDAVRCAVVGQRGDLGRAFTRTSSSGRATRSGRRRRRRSAALSYLFTGWSDGGAQVHNVIAPASATTYTASYVRPPDTTAPTVGVTAPVAGSWVRGSVSILATASDDTGVTGVQFLVNGVALGAPDTSLPYSASWNTTGLSGAQVLTAQATDAAGNATLSAPVTVNVDNAPPTISITAPAASATVSGTVAVSAERR